MKTIDWAAGLFEGKGSAFIVGERRPRLQLKLSDEAELRQFGLVVGGGKVYGPYYRKLVSLTPVWMWVAQGEDALAIARRLLPLLGERKRAAVQRLLDE